jgi:hypothetical protein
METCYKVFRREVLDGIHLRSNRFGFEPEFTAKIARKRLRQLQRPHLRRGQEDHLEGRGQGPLRHRLLPLLRLTKSLRATQCGRGLTNLDRAQQAASGARSEPRSSRHVRAPTVGCGRSPQPPPAGPASPRSFGGGALGLGGRGGGG